MAEHVTRLSGGKGSVVLLVKRFMANSIIILQLYGLQFLDLGNHKIFQAETDIRGNSPTLHLAWKMIRLSMQIQR